MKSKSINPAELIPLDIFTHSYPIAIDLVYANANHPENIFGEIYRPGARLWIHYELAAVLLLASIICHARRPGTVFQAKDGLRTVEAQTLMLQSRAAQDNPHWLEEPGRLLSPPGKGAHPRALAIDVVLIDAGGKALEMGTQFDHLSEDPDYNPAARSFTDLSPEALENRRLLEESMLEASALLEMPIMPLASEWWDFRLPADITEIFAPLWDADLPGQMRMTTLCGTAPAQPDFNERHFDALYGAVDLRVEAARKKLETTSD